MKVSLNTSMSELKTKECSVLVIDLIKGFGRSVVGTESKYELNCELQTLTCEL